MLLIGFADKNVYANVALCVCVCVHACTSVHARVCVCMCVEGKKEEKGFFGGVVESLVAHILKVVQVGGVQCTAGVVSMYMCT